MRLFTANQRHVYLFIRSLVADANDIEDIWQETSLVLWRKFGEFDPGTNFRSWAFRIAHLEVLSHRSRRQRRPMQFGQELIDCVAAELQARSDTLDAQLDALHRCLHALRESDRELIRRRYSPGASGQGVAAELGRSARSLYKAMTRIRRTLHDCIQTRLSREGAS